MVQDRRNEIFDKLHKLPVSRSGDRAPRVMVKLRVQVQLKGQFTNLEAWSLNISRSGIPLCIAKTSISKFTMGQQVLLDIDLDREVFSAQIVSPAIVVRHVTPNDGSLGDMWIGLKFLEFMD